MARTPKPTSPTLISTQLILLMLLIDRSDSTGKFNEALVECLGRLGEEFANDVVTRNTVELLVGFFDATVELGEWQRPSSFVVPEFGHRFGTNGYGAIRQATDVIEGKMKEAATKGVRVPLALLTCLSDFHFGDDCQGEQERLKALEKGRPAFRFFPVACGDVSESTWRSFFGVQEGVRISDATILPFFKRLATSVCQASRSRPGEAPPSINVSGLEK